MMRGKVTAVDASGVYVQTAEYGTLGPCQAVVANYTVGDMVLCVNVGDEGITGTVVRWVVPSAPTARLGCAPVCDDASPVGRMATTRAVPSKATRGSDASGTTNSPVGPRTGPPSCTHEWGQATGTSESAVG